MREAERKREKRDVREVVSDRKFETEIKVDREGGSRLVSE